MPYSEVLAQRVRRALAAHPAVEEKKMFGGIAFMLAGNMCCGVMRDELMVRVGPEQYERALARPHARPMDFTGRPLKGLVYVGPQGHRTDADLQEWVRRGVTFASSLPPK